MKVLKLYREDNGQYNTSEARQDDVSGSYVQKTDYDELVRQLAIRDELSCGTCRGAGTVLIAIDDGIDCPECVERDNEIKADAITEMVNEVPLMGANTLCISEIDDYIENLRGETK